MKASQNQLVLVRELQVASNRSEIIRGFTHHAKKKKEKPNHVLLGATWRELHIHNTALAFNRARGVHGLWVRR